MKTLLSKLWGGVQCVLGFAAGYVLCLGALVILALIFEALQRAVGG